MASSLLKGLFRAGAKTIGRSAAKVAASSIGKTAIKVGKNKIFRFVAPLVAGEAGNQAISALKRKKKSGGSIKSRLKKIIVSDPHVRKVSAYAKKATGRVKSYLKKKKIAGRKFIGNLRKKVGKQIIGGRIKHGRKRRKKRRRKTRP